MEGEEIAINLIIVNQFWKDSQGEKSRNGVIKVDNKK